MELFPFQSSIFSRIVGSAVDADVDGSRMSVARAFDVVDDDI